MHIRMSGRIFSTFISNTLPKLIVKVSYRYRPEIFLIGSECFEKQPLWIILSKSNYFIVYIPRPLIMPDTAYADPLIVLSSYDSLNIYRCSSRNFLDLSSKKRASCGMTRQIDWRISSEGEFNNSSIFSKVLINFFCEALSRKFAREPIIMIAWFFDNSEYFFCSFMYFSRILRISSE